MPCSNILPFDPVLVGQLIEKIVVRNARRIEVVFKSGLVEYQPAIPVPHACTAAERIGVDRLYVYPP